MINNRDPIIQLPPSKLLNRDADKIRKEFRYRGK